MSLKGHCLCGRISYESKAEPLATAICHCKNCQRQGGSAFSIVVVVPSDSVTVSGELKTFEDHGDSGGVVNRQFCPECGSPIFSLLPTAPGMTIIKAGTLDDPSSLAPQMHVWCKSAQPWVSIDTGLPRFPENPPAA